MVDYGYDDVEKWIDFLIDLEARMLVLTGNGVLGRRIINISIVCGALESMSCDIQKSLNNIT
jgi:hypothetical protein